MNILVGLNSSYLEPFKVMAHSLKSNNPSEDVTFFALHTSLRSDELSDLQAHCHALDARFEALRVDSSLLNGAQQSKRYPAEVYYRLLAPHLLPVRLERALYLDCDMLVLNPLHELWNIDLRGNAFAAASHSFVASYATNALNRIRLDTDHDYFNSGVILMDLERARTVASPTRLEDALEKLNGALILPDQDLFNAACGESTLPLNDELWNYDARCYRQYYAASRGEHDMAWLMDNTRILHFCGSRKPWRRTYSGRFDALYKHYRTQALRLR